MHKIIISMGLGIGLSACTPATNIDYAYKPAKSVTLKQKKADVLDCKIEAENKIPTDTQFGTTPRYTSPVSCNTYGMIGGMNYSGSTFCSGVFSA